MDKVKKRNFSVNFYKEAQTRSEHDYMLLSISAKSISVRDYALLPLADPDAQEGLQELMKTMLNYGKAAQLQFDYNTSNLAMKEDDDFVSQMESAMAAVSPDSAYDIVMDPEDPNDKTIYRGLQLNLEGETSVYVNFNREVTSATVDGKNAAITEKNGIYTVKIANIPSGYLSRMYTVVVNIGGTEYTYRVCALSYCNNVLRAQGAPEALKNVCRAIYLYSAAADSYFKTNQAGRRNGR